MAEESKKWPAWVRSLPWLLVASRLVLAAVLVGLACAGVEGAVFVACLTAGYLSDVFDGVLARRLRTVTPALRRCDSLADVVFYVAVLACVCVLHPDVAAAYGWFFAGFLAAEVACQAVSLARFRTTTATHAWLCKTWSVLLYASAALLFGLGEAGIVLWLAIGLGYLAYIDVLLILMLAPRSPVDVPSAIHAWRQRRAVGPRVSPPEPQITAPSGTTAPAGMTTMPSRMT